MSTNRIAGVDLHSEYVPKALYLADADTVEYVRSDVPCVYRRIDGILTLALDFHTRELIGFRIKGFRNFFLNHLKPKIQASRWRFHRARERRGTSVPAGRRPNLSGTKNPSRPIARYVKWLTTTE